MDFFFFSEMFKLDLKILVILSRSNHLNCNFLSKGSLVICFFFLLGGILLTQSCFLNGWNSWSNSI